MQLQQLSGTLGDLGSLRLLDIQRCGLTAVPGSIGQLGLQVLKLGGCPYLQELPDSMSQLHQLQQLHLELPLHHLPSISHLTSVKRLSISHVTDEITTMTHQIGHLVDLESLTLVGWPGLRQLPEGLGDLGALSQLVLRDCGQLMALPQSLGRLRSLRRLVLQGCGLITLPGSLGDLGSLTSLLIHSCDIRDLPSSVGQLTALQQFILVDCPRFRHIPASFGALGQQQQLQDHKASSSSYAGKTLDRNITGSGGSGFTVTISGCEHLQMPISMSRLRRNITPGHLAAAVAQQALQESW
jgi:Leucine-rich repeat (LRR) protein